MPHDITTHPIHLGLGATADVESPITGIEWFGDYAQRRAGDGHEGRLVAQWTFTGNWDSWECHPKGAEVVLCLAGAMTLIQEVGGAERRTELTAGQYAINAPGVWHTADVAETATALFITAGVGTEHRPR